MEKKYLGTTVNERLYISGLMDKFDRAVAEKNLTKTRAILEEVELTEASIYSILESLGLISSSESDGRPLR